MIILVCLLLIQRAFFIDPGHSGLSLNRFILDDLAALLGKIYPKFEMNQHMRTFSKHILIQLFCITLFSAVSYSQIDLTATTLSDSLAGATGDSVTIAFTTTNALATGDEVAVTFPAGFNVSGAGISATTVTTGSDPTVEGVVGQVVTLNVPDAWSAGAQSIVLTGINNPSFSLPDSFLTVVSQTNGAGAPIDAADGTPATFTVRAFLDLTAISLSDTLAGATGDSVTIAFTTATPLDSSNEVTVTFPAGFTVTGAGISSASATTGSDPTVEGVSGQKVTLNVPDAWSAGAQSIILTGITNQSSSSTSLSLTVVTQTDGAASAIDLDDGTPATFTIRAFLDLTAISLSDTLAGATGDSVTVSFTTATALSTNDEVAVTFPAGFNVSGAGISSASATTGSDPTFGGVSGQVVTFNVPDAWSAGSQIIVITGITNQSSSSSSLSLTVVTQTNGAASSIDEADATPATFTVRAFLDLTATSVSDTLAGATGDSVTVSFTTATALSTNDEVAVTFPAGFNVSGAGISSASATTGSDPTFGGVSGQVVTFDVPDAWSAGSQIIVITGITNQSSTSAGLSLTVVTQTNGAASSIDEADATPATFDIQAHLNHTAMTLNNNLANSTGVQATVVFTTATQLVSTDEIIIVFPTGFVVTGAVINTASTVTTGSDPTVGVSGLTITLNVPDTWSAGSQSIVLTGITNPASLASGLNLEIKSQTNGAGADIDLFDQTPATFSIVQSVVNLTSTALSDSFTHALSVSDSVIFTTSTPLISTNEVTITYPAGFDVSGAVINTASTVTTGSDPTVEVVSGQVITLNVTDAWSAGAQTIVLTGINNPTSPSTGLILSIVTRTNGAADTLDTADSTPSTFGIVQSFINLTASTKTNNFTHAKTVTDTIVLTTTTPLISTNEIVITYPAGFDVSGAGVDGAGTVTSGSDPTLEGVSGQVITLNVPDAWPDSIQTIVLTGINNPITPSTGLNLTVVSQTNGAALALDFTDASPATFNINQSFVNLNSTTLSNSFTHAKNDSATANFSTTTPLVATDEISITFPTGFDLTGLALDATSTFTGTAPTVESITGQIVTLTVPGNLPAGTQSTVFTGIKNPDPSASNISLKVQTQTNAAALTLDKEDTSAATFNVDQSFVNVTNSVLSSLFENATKVQATITFTTITPLVSTDEIIITLPSGFSTDRPSVDTSLSTTTTGTYPTVEDFKDNSITLNIIDSLTAGQQVIALTGVINPSASNENAFINVETRTNSGALALDFKDQTPFSFGVGVILTFNPTADQVITAAKTLEVSLSATLVRSSSEISFFAIANPTGSLISSSGLFTWEPAPEQVGDHSAIMVAAGAGITKLDTFKITVQSFDITTDLIVFDTTTVTASEGGTLKANDASIYAKTQVVIPPGALSNTSKIIIQAPDTLDIPGSEINKVLSAVDFAVEGQGDVFTFNKPVDITIEFKNFEVRKNKANMRVHTWDATRKFWKRLTGNHTIDFSNNTVQAQSNHFSIFGAIEIPDTTLSGRLLPGWNMIGIPVSPNVITKPDLVFGDDIGGFHFDSEESNIYELDETTGEWVLPSAIQNPGGYILFGFGNELVDVEGLEQTSDISDSLSFTNNNGWHLLGNPYNVSIDWNSDVTINSNIDNVYYRWTGTEYEFFPGGGLTSTIEKFTGFLVHANDTGGLIEVSFPGPSKNTVRGQPNIDWRIRIIAESGENRDTHNYLGVSQEASRAFDTFDKYELTPLNEEFLSVYFPHESWEDRQGNYTQDIRHSGDEEIIWDIEVASRTTNEEITLTWTIPDELGDEYDVTLSDPGSGKTIDMRGQSGYSYFQTVVAKKSTNNLSVPYPEKVNYDPSNFANKLSQDGVNLKSLTVTVRKTGNEDRGLIPDVYFLEQNYPNPFNPTTTIRYGLPENGHVTLKIFNTLGQEVATLVNSDQTAGIRSVVWNSTNSAGIPVSSGVYFYRINAGSFTQIKRLLLIR